MTNLKTLCLSGMLALSAAGFAQEDNKLIVNGSIQSDNLIPQNDSETGAKKGEHWGNTNTFADLRVQYKWLEAGARFEFLRFPLPGFNDGIESGYDGWGVPNFYIKGKTKWADLTLGTFYEQFGSGFILRTYEERNLGIDNSIMGAHIAVRPFDGLTVKALSGKQRKYWAHNDSWVSGADMELSLDRWFKGLENSNTYLTVGASWVNKHEKEAGDPIIVSRDKKTYKLNLPENVNAFDVRTRLQKGGFNFLAEYAWKTEDPSVDNNFIYRKGNVAMVSTSYSQKGMSILLQAKRSEDMSFRSDRNVNGRSSFINHLPAFTMDNTYALAAMYPYGTQLAEGEWAYQGSFGYNFKRKTFLGGKYGTKINVNFSHVRAIDKSPIEGNVAGTKGYGSAFWKWGDEGMYYQDFNVKIDKKFSKAFKLSFTYMNQFANEKVVHSENGDIRANIFIADGTYKFNKKFTLRAEAQYLNTDNDLGDWWFALAELSFMPHFMFTISDMYNSGVTKTHYYSGLVTYNAGAHRIMAGYSRTRAGINCSGGVCRYVPAYKGFTLSYNFNF